MGKKTRIQTIALDVGLVEVAIRRQRGMRRLTLSISHDGVVTMTGPRTLTIRAIDQFLQTQKVWIETVLRRLHWQSDSIRERKTASERFFRLNHDRAMDRVMERLSYFSTIYSISFSQVAIRNQRSRWGSASSSGNLSFNVRTVHLPDHLFDYVIVHELCHLREPNHSAHFWSLVSEFVPDYKERRRELKNIRLNDLVFQSDRSFLTQVPQGGILPTVPLAL